MLSWVKNKTVFRNKWDKPWRVPVSRLRARRFKKKLWDSGYLSPNFTRREAASKDGTPIPYGLRHAAQRHAFALERVRHMVGDKPIPVLSWYRSPAHNAAVGGATLSQHVNARATDISDSVINSLGRDAYNTAMRTVFANNGIGTDTRTGNVRHVDSRNYRARWNY